MTHLSIIHATLILPLFLPAHPIRTKNDLNNLDVCYNLFKPSMHRLLRCILGRFFGSYEAVFNTIKSYNLQDETDSMIWEYSLGVAVTLTRRWP